MPTGGVEGAAAPVDEGGRYVDATGKPVPTSVARGEEFKRLPAYLRLFMDQREIPALLGELAAAPLPVEVRQFRLNPGGTSGGGGAAASRPPLGGEHNPAFGATGGGRPAGGPRPTESGGPEVGPLDSVVELHGIVYIYNPPDKARLLAAADEAAPPSEP